MTENSRAAHEFTPVQKEQLQKAYQALTSSVQGSDLANLMPSIAKFQGDMAKMQYDAVQNLNALAKSLVSTHNFGVDLAKSLEANIPKFKLDLPPLQLDYTRLLGPALNIENLGLKRIIDTSSLKIFDQIYADQRAQFEGIFENFKKYIEGALPPNWRSFRGLDQIETLLLDEGLALAWVPPADILEVLLAASSKHERRRILGRRWKRVVAACRASIESTSQAAVVPYRKFALNVIKMLEDGHPEGAQALAANLLDTMLRETLDGPSRKEVTNQKTRLSIDDLPMRAAMVFGGIWGSHTEFWPNAGQSVPREFTRHGSAHAVSRKQYSRINAVIALMHVTAYIMLLDSGDLS